jgi:hypothetical protein
MKLENLYKHPFTSAGGLFISGLLVAGVLYFKPEAETAAIILGFIPGIIGALLKDSAEQK